MFKDAETEAKATTGTGVGLILSLFSGGSSGYWAYTLDPAGTGGSILVFPAILVVGLLSITFLVTGIITRNEPYGWSLVLGSIATPVLFIASSNIFRSVFAG